VKTDDGEQRSENGRQKTEDRKRKQYLNKQMPVQKEHVCPQCFFGGLQFRVYSSFFSDLKSYAPAHHFVGWVKNFMKRNV